MTQDGLRGTSSTDAPAPHSITWSARTGSEGGMVKLSALRRPTTVGFASKGSQASALVSHAVRINPGHTTSGHPSRQCLASQRQPRRRTEGLSRTQVERCNPAFDRRDDVLRIRAEVEVKRHEHHDVA